MKKAKIVLIISLLIFTIMLLYFTFGYKKGDEEKPVSMREQYQKEYEEQQQLQLEQQDQKNP